MLSVTTLVAQDGVSELEVLSSDPGRKQRRFGYVWFYGPFGKGRFLPASTLKPNRDV